MFADIIDQANLTTLTATDFKVFDNYILPAFLRLKTQASKDTYVQHVFVACLAKLAHIGHRFLELSIGSRFQRHSKHPKPDEGQPTSFASQELEDEDEEGSLFQHQQSEYLLASQHHPHREARTTIVIGHQSSANPRHHDNQEIFGKY